MKVVEPLTAAITLMVAVAFTSAAPLAQGPQGTQTPAVIAEGRDVMDSLVAADPATRDRGRFRTYQFEAIKGRRYTISMESAAFDAYLTVAHAVGGITDILETDDDGGGGTNARIRFTPSADGPHVVIAQALSRDATGSFTLRIESMGIFVPVAIPIEVGQTRQGTLTPMSALRDDDTPYDLYRFTGVRGQPVVFTMRARPFDAYLVLAKSIDGEFTPVVSDDDGGGNLDARIETTLPDDGEYFVLANAVEKSASGSYTLLFEAGRTVVEPPTQREIQPGQTIPSELTARDQKMTDGSYYQDWRVAANRGERLRVTLRSGAFDAYLIVGRGSGDSFDTLDSNDDGGGGTDAQLEITVNDQPLTIRANTIRAGAVGNYTLIVERLPAP